MITDQGIYFIYRHIRLDTNQVFYIGVGKKDFKCKSHKSIYYRAYNRRSRGDHWKKVVAKTDYEVEILVESDSKDFILQKEKEFIKLYGRKRKQEGSLVNWTEGGNYNENGYSPENNSFKKNQQTVFVYSIFTGEFISSFKSVIEAARSINKKPTYITGAVKRDVSMGIYYFSYTDLGKVIDLTTICVKKKETPVFKIEPETRKPTIKYRSIPEAALMEGLNLGSLYSALSRKRKCGGFYWQKA